MAEPRVDVLTATDPREGRRIILDAASRGPSAIEETTGSVYVLGYREIDRLLNEPRVHGVGLSLFDAMGIAGGPLRDWYGSLMFTNDGARHDRLRRLVIKAFTPRAVDRLRPIAASHVAVAVAALRRAGGGDLVRALGYVPMHAMCALLGIPAKAVGDFINWVDALSPVFGLMEPEEIARAETAIVALTEYVRDLVEQRSAAPGADLISALVRAEHEGDRLTRDETVTMVANLLVGGHDTTSSQIACTLLTLLTRPDVLDELRSDASLLAAVVGETIRFEPSITVAPRTVVAPIEICGIERPVGTMLSFAIIAANRDPRVWREPDQFLPRRFVEPDAPRLLSFGGGPHYCLGAALARMTLEESVRGVAGLMPTLAAAPDTLEWAQVLGQSPVTLPVTV